MSVRNGKKYFIAGGAGFIGAHVVNHILDTSDAQITVFDNFRTGRQWAYRERVNDPRLTVIEGDLKEEKAVIDAIKGHDVVYHFAANSDIAAAADDPGIDFWDGTYLTHSLVEGMRKTGVGRIVYTSGSGVYGEMTPPASEEYPRMIPISTYGASKLGSESLISAYSHMFDMTSTVFRFANVVGPHQTHGVAYDFIRRLAEDGSRLMIYGDGNQRKPYIYVDDIITAFDLLEEKQDGGYDLFNVGSEDHLTVREIADIVTQKMGLSNVVYDFTGGARGWKADVPVYGLDTTKIRNMGWSNKKNSREAVEASVEAMLKDLEAGQLGAS